METTLKSQIKTFICILLLSTILFSCRFGYVDPYPISNSNYITEQNIPLSNFNKVEIGGSFNVFVRYSSKFSITAKGDKYDIDDLEAKVTNGKLAIRYKNNSNRRYEMTFYITMPSFVSGSFSGNSYAEIYNFNEKNIDIQTSGVAKVYVDSDAKNWSVDLSGASNLEILGNGNELVLDASGTSNFKAAKLYVNYIDLSLSGASRAWVNANDEIIGTASGTSGIRYRGNPKVNIRLTGASWVERD